MSNLLTLAGEQTRAGLKYLLWSYQRFCLWPLHLLGLHDPRELLGGIMLQVERRSRWPLGNILMKAFLINFS
jgi:hypothetical protein